MKDLSKMKVQQQKFIKECEFKVKRFIKSLPLDELEVILLSGSVARGDYNPGKFGGMIDLTIIKRDGSNKTATELFGRDEEPEIPYHCIRHLGQWFQIYFNDYDFIHNFDNLNEARKFAILESKVLYDRGKVYEKTLCKIKHELPQKLLIEKRNTLNYISYLLSAYKTERWELREAYPQIHMNLNYAIEMVIKCLFYSNNLYAPAEDRRLYYSYTLPNLHKNYPEIIKELYKQDINSLSDYRRRLDLFYNQLFPMIQS